MDQRDPADALTGDDLIHDAAQHFTNSGRARVAFFDVVRSRVTRVAGEHAINALTFWFAAIGAPWRAEWEEPDYTGSSEVDEHARYEAIATAMNEAMRRAPGFYPTGWDREAGDGWLGVGQGRARDETRVYGREPIVVSSERSSAEAFSPTWFEPTVAGTIQFAATILPQIHPDLRAVALAWRLENPRPVPLLRNDEISQPHWFLPGPDARDEVVISALVPIAQLVGDRDALAAQQAEQCVRTLFARYNTVLR